MSNDSTPSIGKTIKGLLAKILLGFLVLTFAVWGVGDIVRDGASQKIASVGDAGITTAEFQREWRAFQSQMQGQIPADMLSSPLLQQQVLQRMIQRQLLIEASGDAGMYASEGLVADDVRRNPQFQNLRGNFDAELYNRVLQANRLTEAQFMRNIGEDLMVDVMAQTIAMQNLQAPDSWKTLARMAAQETRNVDVVRIPLDTKTKLPPPPETLLINAYNDTTERYMLPEARDFTLATISAKAIEAQAKASITEQEISEYLASQGREENAVEKTQAMREMLPSRTEEAAYQLSITLEDALAGGATLEEAISEADIDASMRTLNGVKRGDLAGKHAKDAPFLGDGFVMEEGDTTNLLATAEGEYYLLHLQSITASQPQAYDAVKSEVLASVVAAERMRRVRQKAEEVRVKLLTATSVSARNVVLREFGLKRDVRSIQRGDDEADGITPIMRAAIFQADLDSVLGPFEGEKQSQNIAILTSIEIPSADDIKSNDGIDKATNAALGNIVGGAVLQSLQKEHPVRVNMQFSNQDAGQ